jgi:Predicted redox protein, regulator of disulfide bond formation
MQETEAADLRGETTVVDETGVGRYQMEVMVGPTLFLVDEPVAVGGLSSGPNPYDLLSAALGACTAMTIRLYANHKGWRLDRIRVRVNHHREALHGRDEFHRDICLHGALDDLQKHRLLEIANRCPVHLTLERGSKVTTELVPTDQLMGNQMKTRSAHMEHMKEAGDL